MVLPASTAGLCPPIVLQTSQREHVGLIQKRRCGNHGYISDTAIHNKRNPCKAFFVVVDWLSVDLDKCDRNVFNLFLYSESTDFIFTSFM